MFRKGETLCVAGGQRGLAVVAVCQCQNKWIWFVLKQWKFLNFERFRPPKSCRGRMDGSQAYTFKKKARMLYQGSYRSQQGGQRQVIGSQSRNRIQIFFYFWTCQEIVELKGNQLEIREVEKKNSINVREMETGVPVTAYGRNRTITA